jgi:hypothetical protein
MIPRTRWLIVTAYRSVNARKGGLRLIDDAR